MGGMQSIFSTIHQMLVKRPEPPLLLVAEDAAIDPALDIHRHDGFELRFLLDEENTAIEELQIVFPGICHASLSHRENEHSYVLYFAPQGMFYRYGVLESGIFRSPYQERLLTVLDAIREKNDRPLDWQEEFYYLLLLLHLRAEAFPENIGKEKKFEQVVRYLQTFYYQKDLSVQDVLRKFGCNPRDAQKIFASLTGMLPNEYLQSVRMQAAEKLLQENRYLVKEVAALCGFSDAHYFANRFKKFFHRSPTEKHLS